MIKYKESTETYLSWLLIGSSKYSLIKYVTFVQSNYIFADICLLKKVKDSLFANVFSLSKLVLYVKTYVEYFIILYGLYIYMIKNSVLFHAVQL